MLVGRGCGRLVGGHAAAVVDQGLEPVGEVAGQGLEQAGQLHERGLEGAGQAGQHDLARRQVGQGRDVGRR